MTDAQHEKLREDMAILQSRIQSIEVQVALMSPAELLQFKGKVLEALRAIDEDIDKISRGCEECHHQRFQGPGYKAGCWGHVGEFRHHGKVEIHPLSSAIRRSVFLEKVFRGRD